MEMQGPAEKAARKRLAPSRDHAIWRFWYTDGTIRLADTARQEVKPKGIKDRTWIKMSEQCVRTHCVSNMERHYQHTSPFPPEFRTTHNFFTKGVFVVPLHPTFSCTM